MRYAFETFLLLYPAPYRTTFASEMASVFAQASQDRRRQGPNAYLRFLFSEFFGLLTGALMEWSEEFVRRSQRRLNVPFVFSIIVGTAFTLFYQGCFYVHLPKVRSFPGTVTEDPQTFPDALLPLLVGGGVLIFLGVFSMAFVWNMRAIGKRSGRLKPIWMPAAQVSGAGKRKERRTGQRGASKRSRPIYGL